MKLYKKIIIGVILLLIVGGLILFLITSNNKDAKKFKEEYEALNGEVNTSGLKHRSIKISKDNPFVYQTAEDIVKRIKNNETFYVYFGSSYCPWCRSVIEQAINGAKEKNIKTIYYVDIWGGNDHTEVLRDVYTIDQKNNLVKTTEGKDSYYELLKYLDKVLGDYTLKDREGNTVNTEEKRITAPNFIYIKNGEAIKLISGIPDDQDDSRMTLTDEMLEEERVKFREFFN